LTPWTAAKAEKQFLARVGAVSSSQIRFDAIARVIAVETFQSEHSMNE
jgi:hypothetical protein